MNPNWPQPAFTMRDPAQRDHLAPQQAINPCQHGMHLRLHDSQEGKPKAILQSCP